MARRPGLPDYLQEGFTLPYGRDEAPRFHVLAFIAAVSFAAWVTWGYKALLVLAVLSACPAYYFFPFTERNRIRLGANQAQDAGALRAAGGLAQAPRLAALDAPALADGPRPHCAHQPPAFRAARRRDPPHHLPHVEVLPLATSKDGAPG